MKKLIILIVVLFTYSNANAEQRIVSGKVLLNDQFALGNIIVTAKKSKASVSTNLDGEFFIACEENDILIFTAQLFRTVKHPVRKKDELVVNMQFSSLIDETKMVDMGYVKYEDAEAAMRSINKSEGDYSKYVSIDELIRSKFPFVDSRGNGSYVFRGLKSIQRSSAALLELDGAFVNDFTNINPEQVRSIKAFQASEAVLYGSRGANGVIVITTKKR